MKSKFKLLPLALLLPALLVLCPARAPAQVTPNTTQHALTNGTTVLIAAAGQSNIVATVPVALDVRSGRGAAFLLRASSTNASTAQVGVSFAVSADGVNYTTTPQFWLIGALNGTTGVTWYTNFPPALLDNYQKIKVLSVTNGHNASLFVSNVVASWSQ